MRELTQNEVDLIAGGCRNNQDNEYGPNGGEIKKPKEGPDTQGDGTENNTLTAWLNLFFGG